MNRCVQETGAPFTASGGRRRGLSLIEVLISMFVLMVGLLGVASLLPVGQIQISKGETEEAKRNVADGAFALIQATLLDPSKWYAWNGSTYVPYDATDPASGTRRLMTAESGSTASALTSQSLDTPSLAGAVIEFRTGGFRGVRRRLSSHTGTTYNVAAALPEDPAGSDTFVVYRNSPFALDPLFITAQQIAGNDGFRALAGSEGTADPQTKMVRVQAGLGQGAGAITTNALAEHLCLWQDDLVFREKNTFLDDPNTTDSNEDERDEYGEIEQVFHRVDDSGTAQTAKRKSLGEYSWLATFVPQSPDPSLDTSARTSEVDYTVSVAVFYRRLVRGSEGLKDDQLEVNVTFNAGGFGGGAATLGGTNDVLKKAKQGEWILVWNTSNPTRAFHWYQMTTLEPVGSGTTRAVTLSGPDWNTTSLGTAGGAKIFPGCVGVYQQQMQVERLPER